MIACHCMEGRDKSNELSSTREYNFLKGSNFRFNLE